MPTLQRGDALLHYEIMGEGQPIVYISGFSDHTNSVFSTSVRTELGTRGQVFSLDNRGSGQTRVVPAAAPVTIETMADDVAALMDAHQLERAHVLGISMGGAIALVLALRHPARVRSLVTAVSLAASMTPPARTPFLLETVQLMRDQQYPPALISRFTAVFLLSEEAFRYEAFMEAWLNAPPDPLRQTREGFELQLRALEHYDIRSQLHTLQLPVLVVSSPDDLLVPPRLQEEIAAGIPGAQMQRYPGGHIFMGLPMFREPFFRDVFAFWEAVDHTK